MMRGSIKSEEGSKPQWYQRNADSSPPSPLRPSPPPFAIAHSFSSRTNASCSLSLSYAYRMLSKVYWTFLPSTCLASAAFSSACFARKACETRMMHQHAVTKEANILRVNSRGTSCQCQGATKDGKRRIRSAQRHSCEITRAR